MKKMKNNSFEFLMFNREGKVILGNKWKNGLVILIILLATFLSLGLSKGSTDYLKIKMDDPFNTWISFKKNYNIDNKELTKLMDSLSSNNCKVKFNISDSKTHLFSYIITPIFIPSTKSKSKKNVWHITLDQDDTLFKYISSDMLQVRNSILKSELVKKFNNSHGIIIKKSLINQLGFKSKNFSDLNYLKFRIPFDQINIDKISDFYTSIPVLGVVDDLPLGVDFICSKNTYYYLNHLLYNRTAKYNCDYDVSNLDTNLKMQIFLDKNVQLNDIENKTGWKLSKLPNKLFWESDYVSGSYYNVDSKITFKEFNEKIKNLFPFDSVHIIEDFENINERWNCQETDFTGNLNESDPGFVTIQLSDLKKISEVKSYLDNFPKLNNFEKSSQGLINIDVSAIKSRKNLLFISELTKVLSIFLLIFSMFSILIFLMNIINTHFERIKQNIGTLKAFGLSNSKLISNYIFIYSLIIFITSVIAFITSIGLGYFGFSVIIFNVLDITIENGQKCFDLINLNGVASFIFINILSISVVYFRLRKILLSTPGDLIFER